LCRSYEGEIKVDLNEGIGKEIILKIKNKKFKIKI